ncbi:HET domain-containing protein [Trichoderma evansii]
MPAELSTYHYHPLRDSEIRLIQLHPAQQYRDDISLTIFHQSLTARKDESKTTRLSRTQLQSTLPKGWEVFETPEGRYLFCNDPTDEDESEQENDDDDDETEDDNKSPQDSESDGSGDGDFVTTWEHPDANIDRALYELPPESTFWEQDTVFEALSYQWGTPNNPGTAFVKPSSIGDASVATFSIGKNLESALRHLRYTSKPRTLWIDAICINQNDNAEKAAQVVRMADIYSLAARVVVWLGPAEDDSDLAISTLAYLGAQVETTLDAYRLTSPGAEEPMWYDIDCSLPYSDAQWNAIECLILRGWFTRVWTAQEIHLANRLAIIQVGNAILLWSLFRRATECLKDKPNHGDERLSLSKVTSSTLNGKGRPLSDLFRRFAHRECSNGHDKVYGLMAMVPPAFVTATRPDYTQPVAKTYADAFIADTKLLERWEIFGCDVIDRTSDFDSVPSWVPDLKSSKRHAYYSGLLQFTTGNSRLDYQFVDSTKFRVRGLRCATVKKVGIYAILHPQAILFAIRLWEPENIYTGTYVTGEPLLDAFAKTLLQNDLRERNPTDKGWPTLAGWRAYCKRYILSGSTEPLEILNSSHYLDDMVSGRCGRRAYMETEEGYIGLGPRGCKPGDIVCVIPGCNSPVVLRETDSGDFRLVGSSFVYGLNDGQALLGNLKNPWRVQIFDHPDQDFRIEHRYYNKETRELAVSDPRLEEHPEWERVSLEDLGRPLTGDDPIALEFFKNKVTGEIMNSDPRLLPEALKARGVDLQWFTIV